jgi:hypothetical protein
MLNEDTELFSCVQRDTANFEPCFSLEGASFLVGVRTIARMIGTVAWAEIWFFHLFWLHKVIKSESLEWLTEVFGFSKEAIRDGRMGRRNRNG